MAKSYPAQFINELQRDDAAHSIRMLSLLNLLTFAAMGLSAPYLNLYLKNIGFSGAQIGLLISITAFLELTLNPAANAWADRTHSHRLLYRVQVGILGGANLLLGLTAMPALLGGAYVANGITLRASGEILSQLTLTRLDQLHRQIFGKIRLWGSVGWAMTTLLSGMLISIGSYPLVLIASAVVRLLQLPFINQLPASTDSDDDASGELPSMRRGIRVLMISQFLFFIGLNAYGSFIWIHMQEGFGIAAEQIGIYAAIFALSEIIPLMFVDRLIQRWGVRRVLILGMAGMCIEWVAFAFLPGAGWIPLFQLARSVTFTMFVIGIAMIVATVSQPARVATNRALILVTMPALAMLLTSPIAGWLYDVAGAKGLFSAASLMGVLAVVYLLANYQHIDGTAALPVAVDEAAA